MKKLALIKHLSNGQQPRHRLDRQFGPELVSELINAGTLVQLRCGDVILNLYRTRTAGQKQIRIQGGA